MWVPRTLVCVSCCIAPDLCVSVSLCLCAASDMLDDSIGGTLPVSGIILSPWTGHEQAATGAASGAATAAAVTPRQGGGGGKANARVAFSRSGGAGASAGDAAGHNKSASDNTSTGRNLTHAGDLGDATLADPAHAAANPPVSGIIFSPAQPPAAAGHPRQGGTTSRGGGGDQEELDYKEGHIKGLIARIAKEGGRGGGGADRGPGVDAWSALRDLQRVLRASSSSSAAKNDSASAATRHEVLKSKGRTEQVVAVCVRGLHASGAGLEEGEAIALACLDVLALVVTDISARQAIIDAMGQEEGGGTVLASHLTAAASAAAASGGGSVSDGAQLKSVSLHHLLLLVGNLAIDANGRKILLADDVISQQLLRLLFSDLPPDAPGGTQTRRFSAGALRSLVLDARGKELVLKGFRAMCPGALILDRLADILDTSQDASTSKYVTALIKRLKSKNK
eukprot:Tamp_11429.p1 GENE.Tamp_11429~~Tamp_11429.p1  ORF type:complete len:452 (+),score=65.61 Tamp_11429:331-1686(+)